MTREEIKNTPELVDFMLDESVIADSRMKLHKRLDELCELAIKALDQELCEDAISRKAVKEALINRIGESIPDCINATPSVTPKQGWIPVSERLPEIHQDVLLELRSGEMLTGFKAETEPYFYCHGVDGCYVEPQNVLAWQPLPEPYKAEKGGE